jgi:hypothetical protein
VSTVKPRLRTVSGCVVQPLRLLHFHGCAFALFMAAFSRVRHQFEPAMCTASHRMRIRRRNYVTWAINVTDRLRTNV